MKKCIFFITAILIFSVGCKKKNDSLNQTVDFIGERSKKIGESTFTITSVLDNRCPANAICVKAGSARVSLKVQTDFDVQNFNLCLGDCKEIGATDNITFTTGNIKFWVKLKKVSPPDETKILLPKVVTLEITKG